MANPDPDQAPERFSLSRWSRRKLEAASKTKTPAAPNRTGPGLPVGAPPAGAVAPASPDAGPVLPPIESLSFDSDFSAFLQPKVEETVRRAALRKLFSDPRFNVMDGLDVYIDDYSISQPVPPDVLARLAHAQFVLNPPRTRVNERGQVEDMPEEPADERSARREKDAGDIASSEERLEAVESDSVVDANPVADVAKTPSTDTVAVKAP